MRLALSVPAMVAVVWLIIEVNQAIVSLAAIVSSIN